MLILLMSKLELARNEKGKKRLEKEARRNVLTTGGVAGRHRERAKREEAGPAARPSEVIIST